MARRAIGSSYMGVDSSTNLSTVMLDFSRSSALIFVCAVTGAKSLYTRLRTERTTRIVAAI